MKSIFTMLAVIGMLSVGMAAVADDGYGYAGRGGFFSQGPAYNVPNYGYTYRPYSAPSGYSFYGRFYPYPWESNSGSQFSRNYGSPYNPNLGSPYFYYRSPSYYGGQSAWGQPYSGYSSPFRGYSTYGRQR